MKMKRTSLLALLLLFSLTAGIFALSLPPVPKEESVYVKLLADGQVDAIYVVNSFDLDQEGRIIDHGDYAAFRAITASKSFEPEGQTITIDAQAGKFYYEGRLAHTALPWRFDIRYFLDGQALTAQELAGQSGDLELRLAVGKNPGGDEVFFKSYALQISVKLDTELCKDIQAEKATLANEGRYRLVNFTVLPGTTVELGLTARVKDFEMEGLSINGIRMTMDFELDDADLTDKLQELQDGVAELDDGAVELRDGAKELAEGTQELAEGVGELLEGVDELADGTGELDDGVKDLRRGVRDLHSGMKDLSRGLGDLKRSNTSLLAGLEAILQPALDAAAPGFAAAFPTAPPLTLDNLGMVVGGVLEGIEGGAVDAALLAAKGPIQAGVTAAVRAGLEAEFPGEVDAMLAYPAVQAEIEAQTLAALEAQRPAIEASVAAALAADGDYQSLQQLKGLADYYEGFQAYLGGVGRISDGAKAASDGMEELVEGVGDLRQGTVELKNGVIDLQEGVIELFDGAVELSEGTVELHDGTVKLAEGTMEFRDKTSTIEKDFKDTIKEKIDEIFGTRFATRSFVSDKNQAVLLVQFAMRTEAIRLPEQAEVVETEEAPPHFWQRLLALFNGLR